MDRLKKIPELEHRIQVAVRYMLAAFVLLGAGTTYGFWQARQARHEVQAQILVFRAEVEKRCTNEQNNRAAIRKSLNDSKKRLPQVGYYQDNPGELKTALDDIDNQLKLLFPPIRCENEQDGAPGEDNS